MSCVTTAPTFRLLDGYAGWDIASFEQLDGAWDPEGIRLAAGPKGVAPSDVWPYLPPPRLAYDCPTCTWYLVTPHPPDSRLLRLGPCDSTWQPVDWPAEPSGNLIAVTVHSRLIAAIDKSLGGVRVWTRAGHPVGNFAVPEATDLAFASPCELLVVSEYTSILRYDPAGAYLGKLALALPKGFRIEAIEVSADGAVWLLVRDSIGSLGVWTVPCHAEARVEGLKALRDSLPDTGLRRIASEGFCIIRRASERSFPTVCFSWYGRSIPAPPTPPAPPQYARKGQLLTTAIDSGVPRCMWHRLRIDADVPQGTKLEVAVATAETVDELVAQGQPDARWPGFATGVPHPDDWQTSVLRRDFLIDQPAGRYLFVRLRLVGDGLATPVVRRIRLDFPRSTSAQFLPAVYQEEPRAAEFTERFLSLFDATLADLDRAVETFPALFDSQRVSDEVLPWLGQFLGVTFDPSWDAARRRAILLALPDLYRKRGTLEGLAEAIRLVFDEDPVIEEPGADAFWGAVASTTKRSPLDGRLGAVRLFGRSAARFRLGQSKLTGAPLRSYGDPALDPLTAGAHRFKVLLPGAGRQDSSLASRLERLVDSQKPAHTVVGVSIGSESLILAGTVRVGIDTRLAAPPPAVLGIRGNLRLGRDSVLRGHGTVGPVIGHTSVVPPAC